MDERIRAETCTICDGQGWYWRDNGHGQPERHHCCGNGKRYIRERKVTKWVRV